MKRIVGLALLLLSGCQQKKEAKSVKDSGTEVNNNHPQTYKDLVPTLGIGVGVIITNDKNEILLIQRKGFWGNGMWAYPGGKLEYGETFEECAIREAEEEVGLTLTSPKFLAMTNIMWEKEKYQFITVLMEADCPVGQIPENCEPDKCSAVQWFPKDNLPFPLFPPLQQLKEGKAYGTSLLG
jgi:8-oxo-dGTP diphosphatase